MTNVQKMRKLTDLVNGDAFYGAMMISKLEEMASHAINNPDEVRKLMHESGADSMIDPRLVIQFWEEVYDIVKFD